MKKFLLALAAMLALSCVLSGCGPKEADPDTMQQKHDTQKKNDEGK